MIKQKKLFAGRNWTFCTALSQACFRGLCPFAPVSADAQAYGDRAVITQSNLHIGAEATRCNGLPGLLQGAYEVIKELFSRRGVCGMAEARPVSPVGVGCQCKLRHEQ